MKCSRCTAPVDQLYDFTEVVWLEDSRIFDDIVDQRMIWDGICEKCYKGLLRP